MMFSKQKVSPPYKKHIAGGQHIIAMRNNAAKRKENPLMMENFPLAKMRTRAVPNVMTQLPTNERTELWLYDPTASKAIPRFSAKGSKLQLFDMTIATINATKATTMVNTLEWSIIVSCASSNLELLIMP